MLGWDGWMVQTSHTLKELLADKSHLSSVVISNLVSTNVDGPQCQLVTT
jgi:hypothetical protein